MISLLLLKYKWSPFLAFPVGLVLDIVIAVVITDLIRSLM